MVAHRERAPLRVGDKFEMIDADQTATDIEAMATAMVTIPTPEILWRRLKPPVHARPLRPPREDTRSLRHVARGRRSEIPAGRLHSEARRPHPEAAGGSSVR